MYWYGRIKILLYCDNFNCCLNRHPEAQARPIFKDILMQLLDNDKVVLKIPKHDSSTHALADRVGGPLEAGEKMYTDLQWKYFTASDDEEHA